MSRTRRTVPARVRINSPEDFAERVLRGLVSMPKQLTFNDELWGEKSKAAYKRENRRANRRAARREIRMEV